MKSYQYGTPQLYKLPKQFTQGRSVLGACQCGMGEYSTQKSLFMAAAIGGLLVAAWISASA